MPVLKNISWVLAVVVFAGAVVVLSFYFRPKPCQNLANSGWVYECAKHRTLQECLSDAKVVLGCED